MNKNILIYPFLLKKVTVNTSIIPLSINSWHYLIPGKLNKFSATLCRILTGEWGEHIPSIRIECV